MKWGYRRSERLNKGDLLELRHFTFPSQDDKKHDLALDLGKRECGWFGWGGVVLELLEFG